MYVQEVKSSYKKHSHIVKSEEEEEDTEVLGNKIIREIEFKQISVGYEFACGITYSSGDLHCWGGNQRVKDLLHDPIPGPFKQVSVGKLGVCAIRATDESLVCFGRGIHARMAKNPPSENTQFDQVKVGFLTACAVDFDSQLHCWGGQSRSEYDIVVA